MCNINTGANSIGMTQDADGYRITLHADGYNQEITIRARAANVDEFRELYRQFMQALTFQDSQAEEIVEDF